MKVCKDVSPIPAGTISVAAGGASVVESFLQLSPYYSGRDLYYLVPKVPLSTQAKLYYCICIKKNRFRFSYGRQANSTLEGLPIPPPEKIPAWVKDFPIRDYARQMLDRISVSAVVPLAETREKEVTLDTLFIPVNGVASSEVERHPAKVDDSYVPYIRPSYRQETSIDGFVSKEKVPDQYTFPEGTLYVSTDGQGSHTYAYVSVSEFVPNSNVTVLVPTRTMGLLEKLYYSHCITNNRYKFAYARKPKGDRLKAVMLPETPPAFVTTHDFSGVLSRFYSIVEELWGHD